MLLDRYAGYFTLAGRSSLAAIFVVSGLMKFAAPAETAAYVASYGLPLPMAATIGAGVLEVAAGLLVLAGFQTRWAALALAIFLVPVTVIFHNPIGLADAEAQLQMTQALKNLGIIGGLLLVAAFGPGRISVDNRMTAAAGRERETATPNKMAA